MKKLEKLFELNLFGLVYTVILDNTIEDGGETCHKSQYIKIDDTLPLELQRMTLIHEILHVILDIKMEYVNKAAKEIKDDDLREHLYIGGFSTHLQPVFKDNPHLRRWLWDD